MIQFFYSFIVCTFLCSCNNAPTNKIGNEASANSILNKDTIGKSDFASGCYQDISLAVENNNTITGVYEYYDNWDEIHKEYLNINVFYFFGKINHDSIAEVIGAWPGSNQQLNGKILSYKGKDVPYIKMNLNREPLGYNEISFKNGVAMNFSNPKSWIEVRIIKTGKAKTFDLPDLTNIRKGYLVKNDIVKILLKEPTGWDKIEYNPKNDKNKSSILWIKDEDLYDVNPTKW